MKDANYRLVKYTQGNKVWYEIQKCIKYSFLGKWFFGYDDEWILCSDTVYCGCGETEEDLKYDDEAKALQRFSELEKVYSNSHCEIEEEVLKEI